MRLPTGPTSNNFSCETISNVFPKLLRCHDFSFGVSFLFSWQWPCCSECKAILRINLFKIIFHLKAVFGPDTCPRTDNIGRRTWADYQQSFTDLAVHSSQISHMADWQPFNASLRTIAIIMARTSNSDQSQLPISHCWRTVPISSNNRSATSSKLSSETGYLPLGEEWRDHIFHWPIIYHYRSVHFILTFTFLSGSAIWHSYHTAPTILGWYFGDVIQN